MDLEPITYPSHLAQTTAPSVAGPSSGARQRDYTMGSGSGPFLSSSSVPILGPRDGPGAGGPPTGVPKRKESIVLSSSTSDLVLGEELSRVNLGSKTSLSVNPVNRSRSTSASASVGGTKDESGRPTSKGSGQTNGNGNGKERESADSNSGGDDTIRKRSRAPTTGRRDREKTPSTVVPRSDVHPLLPSAKIVPRAPASAMYFSPLPFHGRPPLQALRAHTGTLVGDKIWFLGGVDAKNCWRGVAWFDTETLLWSTVETFGETLPPLRAHTTTLVGDKLYVFGGGDGPTYSNDVWVFDTKTHRFARPNISTPKSALPLPRRAHTTVLYRNFLVVFGGGNGQAALNDVWALDVSDPNRLTWHEWRTRGEVPMRKGYHTSNLVGDKMVVFGGSDGHASFADVHVLNLQTLTWTLVNTEIKHNRLSHTSTQVGSYLFIIGGHNGQSYAQDVLLFNLVTLAWESKSPRGIPPPGRGYHVALLHDARIFISGGYNGVSVFDDLWVLDLSAGAYLPQVVSGGCDPRGGGRLTSATDDI
ncbi:hypothetical protein P7C73_g6729, partial [Tremellales sp. Uapishka_1]